MRTFDATVTREGKWWAVVVKDIPGYCVVTQGRDLPDAEFMARDAVALALEIPIEDVAVRLHVSGMDEGLAELARVRVAAEEGQRLVASLAQQLIDQGVSLRDAGLILNLSHQRVGQLVGPRRKAA
jgi:predicted RNase H-like HicB family nuclease